MVIAVGKFLRKRQAEVAKPNSKEVMNGILHFNQNYLGRQIALKRSQVIKIKLLKHKLLLLVNSKLFSMVKGENIEVMTSQFYHCSFIIEI